MSQGFRDPDRVLLENQALRRQIATLELDLREGELKHRVLFESSNDAILLMCHDGFIDCNTRTLTMFGCSREQIIGAPLYAFSPPLQPDGRRSDESLLEKVNLALTEGPQFFVWKHCRADRSPFAAEVSLNRLELRDGVLLQAIVRDITERTDTGRALRERDQKYRELVEHANSIILRWTHEGRITFLNEFGQRTFGYTEAEILGRHVVGSIVPERDSTGRNLRPLLEEISADPKKFERVVNENMRRNGERLWIDWTNKVVFDEQGQISEVLSIGSDITERKRTAQALSESQTQLSLILNNVSDVIFAIAVESLEQFRFTSVNCRFLEATGLSERQVVGALVQDVIPEPARSFVLQKYNEAIQTGLPVRWDEVSEYPAGTKVGHVTIVPVFDAHNICVQLVGMVHDITERKQAEENVRTLNEELRRHAEALDQRVRDRTAQLAARNQELKDFAYTVSHDLKAPLRGIAGYASELDRKHRGGLSDRAQFCLKQILVATSHLDHLIEDLLHYSRLDAETPTLTEVDLSDLVGTVLRDRDFIITEQHVEVTLSLSVTMLRTWERGLVQIVTNLIDNAIKYSRNASPPRLRIATTLVDGNYRMCVGDNGIGFDMKYHDRLFGLFNRLVRSEEYEGSGAGLAIVKKLLDKQGGRIWAESAPGQGATFFVEIPNHANAVDQ